MGFAVEAVSGSRRDVGGYYRLDEATGEGLASSWSFDFNGLRSLEAPKARCTYNGVPVTLYRGRPSDGGSSDQGRAEFLGVYERPHYRFRPRCIVTYGGAPMDDALRSPARARGGVVVSVLHNFAYRTHGRNARIEARRRRPEHLEARAARIFHDLKPSVLGPPVVRRRMNGVEIRDRFNFMTARRRNTVDRFPFVVVKCYLRCRKGRGEGARAAA